MLVIVAICVASACVSLSIGVLSGLDEDFAKFVEETGVYDVITVAPNYSSPAFAYAGSLTEEDGDQMAQLDGQMAAGGELVWWQFPIYANGRRTNQILAGAVPEVVRALRHEVTEGRSITDLDNLLKRRVIVLGQKAAMALFPGREPLGQHVQIGNVDFVIVGVLRKYAYYDGNDANQMPYKNGYNFIPLRTAQALFVDGSQRVSYIQIRASSAAGIDNLKEKVRASLFVRHRSADAYSVSTSASQATQWSKTQQAMKIGLSILSAASLVIGATCMLNAQLSSVAERVREFGVRRSIGASRHSIIGLVMLETFILSVIGGIVGTVSSLGVIPFVRYVLPSGFPGAPIFVWWSLPLSLASTVLVGFIAGLWPAFKAAQLDPHEAMRVT